MIQSFGRQPSRTRQLVISVEDVLDELIQYRPLFQFSTGGLDGVIHRLMTIDQRDLLNWYGLYSEDSLGLAEYAVEVVKEELYYEIDRRIAENTLPQRFDVDEHLLRMVLTTIADYVTWSYCQFLGTTQYYIRDAIRLAPRGQYLVVAELP